LLNVNILRQVGTFSTGKNHNPAGLTLITLRIAERLLKDIWPPAMLRSVKSVIPTYTSFADCNSGNSNRPANLKLPYFREHCPECLNVWTKHKEVPRPARPTAVHEVWQVDHQEGHRLGDGSIAPVCNTRDPYGALKGGSLGFLEVNIPNQ